MLDADWLTGRSCDHRGKRGGARPPVSTKGEELESMEGSGRLPGLSARLAVVSLHSRNKYQVYARYALDYLMKSVVNGGVWHLESIAKHL